MNDTPLEKRAVCPCCGYPTLSEPVAYEICELCNWEDDGQGDADAEEVRGDRTARTLWRRRVPTFAGTWSCTVRITTLERPDQIPPGSSKPNES
jgi:hypothetical protein